MTSLKRNSDVLSPPINEIQKKYQWTPITSLEQNRFFHLTTTAQEPDQSLSNSNNTQINDADNSTRKTKIPPIFLQGTLNHKEVVSDIGNIVSHDYTTSLSSGSFKINLTNEDDFRLLTKHYTENKIKFYTYRNPSDKPISIVIKNVPLSLTENDILEDLHKYNLPIVRLTRLLYRDKTPMPVCAVDLQATEQANEIFKIDQICKAIVRIEARRVTKGTPQCHRCQLYGHTKNYCSLTPRCVRCQGSHLSAQCEKPKQAPPVCANCGGEHPANYKGCEFYLNHIQQRNQHRTQNPPNTLNTAPSSSQRNNIRTQRSYADILKNPNNHDNLNNTNTAENTSNMLNAILTSLFNLIKPFITQIKNFLLSSILPIFTNVP